MRASEAFFRHALLIIYLVLLAALLIALRPTPQQLISSVDWRTVLSIYGFLLIVSAVSNTGLFERIAGAAVSRVHSKRGFTIAVITVTAFLAALITNDIALFVVLPIVFAVPLSNRDKLVLAVLLAIAANLGALLSPVGNPQKIMLWQESGQSFLDFLLPFVPLFIVSFLGLVAYAYFLMSRENLKPPEVRAHLKRHAAAIDGILFFVYLALLSVGYWEGALAIAILYFLVFYREAFLRVDYEFILLLTVLFLDFGLMGSIPAVRQWLAGLDLSNPLRVFLLSFALTQFMSDVPTAVLLSQYSNQYVAIGAGTAMGATLLIVASLANIISVRLSDVPGGYLRYHKYSLPFAVFLLLVGVLFFSL